VRVTDTDTVSYVKKDPSKVLEVAEKIKKNKYLQPCLDQRPHFTLFIVLVDSLVGKEAKTVLKVLAARTKTKAGKSYSSAMGY
jgi:hypothetical protein